MSNLLLFLLVLLILALLSLDLIYRRIRRDFETGDVLRDALNWKIEGPDMVSQVRQFMAQRGADISENTVQLAMQQAKTLVAFLHVSGKKLRDESDVLALAKSLVGSGAIQACAYNVQKQTSDVAVKLPSSGDGTVA